MKTLSILLLLLFGAVCASAQQSEGIRDFESDGNNFLMACSAEGHSKLVEAMCVSYVGGTSDGYQLAQWMTPGFKYKYCVPDTASRKQLFDVTVKFMNEHPELRHKKTAELAALAFIKAFPCRN